MSGSLSKVLKRNLTVPYENGHYISDNGNGYWCLIVSVTNCRPISENKEPVKSLAHRN